MRVDFYHLTTRPLDRVLPQIAARVLAEGGRLLIVAGDETQRTGLDRLLWTYSPDSFLPHGLAGSGDEATQPVLIAGEVTAGNGARHVALVDGRWRDEVTDGASAFDRAFHFFDEEHIEAARLAWKALGARDGIERSYWRQKEEGGWEKVA
ncbi:DNA polymerase III subunit chi [Sphingomonas bacterium]|uniref:DNA polymerase III subunit chi n=1 Tax=Sphingomonas bacterium TaxID=1895847 RepID=UPI001576FB5C|nr:DNA polymerase III subunit chi [Sphingomonas bacterium]